MKQYGFTILIGPITAQFGLRRNRDAIEWYAESDSYSQFGLALQLEVGRFMVCLGAAFERAD